jgi:hypothetical protein
LCGREQYLLKLVHAQSPVSNNSTLLLLIGSPSIRLAGAGGGSRLLFPMTTERRTFISYAVTYHIFPPRSMLEIPIETFLLVARSQERNHFLFPAVPL